MEIKSVRQRLQGVSSLTRNAFFPYRFGSFSLPICFEGRKGGGGGGRGGYVLEPFVIMEANYTEGSSLSFSRSFRYFSLKYRYQHYSTVHAMMRTSTLILS